MTVLDKNDSPPSFRETQLEFSVSEDLPAGSVVGTLRATDPDTLGQLRYQLLSGGEGHFLVEPTSGVLRLNESLDREDRDTYRLMVRAHDGVQYADAHVKITVSLAVFFVLFIARNPSKGRCAHAYPERPSHNHDRCQEERNRSALLSRLGYKERLSVRNNTKSFIMLRRDVDCLLAISFCYPLWKRELLHGGGLLNPFPLQSEVIHFYRVQKTACLTEPWPVLVWGGHSTACSLIESIPGQRKRLGFSLIVKKNSRKKKSGIELTKLGM